MTEAETKTATETENMRKLRLFKGKNTLRSYHDRMELFFSNATEAKTKTATETKNMRKLRLFNGKKNAPFIP